MLLDHKARDPQRYISGRARKARLWILPSTLLFGVTDRLVSHYHKTMCAQSLWHALGQNASNACPSALSVGAGRWDWLVWQRTQRSPCSYTHQTDANCSSFPRFKQVLLHVCRIPGTLQASEAASEPKAPEVALCHARNDPQAPAWIVAGNGASNSSGCSLVEG
jgi:hypothetical protein